MLKEHVEELISKVTPEAVHLRHELHKIPEIAGQEFKTSAAVRNALAPLELELQQPFLKTDVIALLNREKKGNITLRADMDALPITETHTERTYCSIHPGMMHSCGHDGHTAMLWGAAKVLSAIRDEIPCSVRFLFQPGEEIACLAKNLISTSALKDPEPDFITGLHNWPNEPYGKICSKPGIMMAAAGFFKILLYGKSGHGSLPALAINPIECAAEIITACKDIVPKDCVLSFCSCSSSGSKNNTIIPDMVELLGTIRFLNRENGEILLKKFNEVTDEISSKYSVKYNFSCPVPYLPVINEPSSFVKIQKIVVEQLGKEQFHELSAHVMSSEDFSWYLEKYPGVFCHLGAGDGLSLHSSNYDFDDSLIPVGIRYFCAVCLSSNLFCQQQINAGN